MMQCEAACCVLPADAWADAPGASCLDLADLQQQALAAPGVVLLEQADWYRGVKNPEPRPDEGYGKLLIQAQDLANGVLNTALARFGGSDYISETLAVWPHDLVVCPTPTGYRAQVIDVHAHFPGRPLYCAAPLFGIFVKPMASRQPLLLPGYLAWWLNQHQVLCEGPEALIKSRIPLPSLVLQRQLLVALSGAHG